MHSNDNKKAKVLQKLRIFRGLDAFVHFLLSFHSPSAFPKKGYKRLKYD